MSLHVTALVDAARIESFLLNRDDRIRTCGILLPKQARYQAALHPVQIEGLVYYINTKGKISGKKGSSHICEMEQPSFVSKGHRELRKLRWKE